MDRDDHRYWRDAADIGVGLGAPFVEIQCRAEPVDRR
jgi:hypothetical protein